MNSSLKNMSLQNPKRILILSGLKIFPNQSGGHLRSGSVAKSLARMGHEVCIYSIAGRRGDYSNNGPMLYQGIEENLVEEVNLSLTIGLIQAVARRLGLPRVWQYILLRMGLIPPSLRNRLDWADVILCDLPYTPPVPGPWKKKTWLLLSHNLEHRLMAQGTFTERLFSPWMERIEMVAPLRYDGILACAKEDSEYFKNRSSNPESVRLVANGIDPDLYNRSGEEGKGLRKSWGLSAEDWLIVFSGSRFGPNLEALAKLLDFCAAEHKYLVENRIRFLILGSICSSARVTDTMIVTGPVKETYPYFAAADAALNPIQIGSGSNVKIFEYLAARLPVISTLFGTRGTVLEPEQDFVVFHEGRLKESLDRLLRTQSKAMWNDHAERVWTRVQDSCDMTAILRREWKGFPMGKASPQNQLNVSSPAISGTHSR
ncbi:MAG: glycosyltransferase [Oligoflexus sp.]|nr:glycosyltransferase [Oligoflexus sp.]